MISVRIETAHQLWQRLCQAALQALVHEAAEDSCRFMHKCLQRCQEAFSSAGRRFLRSCPLLSHAVLIFSNIAHMARPCLHRRDPNCRRCRSSNCSCKAAPGRAQSSALHRLLTYCLNSLQLLADLLLCRQGHWAQHGRGDH